MNRSQCELARTASTTVQILFYTTGTFVLESQFIHMTLEGKLNWILLAIGYLSQGIHII